MKTSKHFKVAIFGSARIKKNSSIYKEVKSLAKDIAGLGMDVVTGGGPGLMHAANEGHRSGQNGNNSHSIGLSIKLPKEKNSNIHLDIKKDFDRFSDRLDTFMALSNVVIVTPGGIGTILELFYTWQLKQVKHICDTPIILYGSMWEGLIQWMKKTMQRKKLIAKSDFNNIYLVENKEQAINIIKKLKRINVLIIRNIR